VGIARMHLDDAPLQNRFWFMRHTHRYTRATYKPYIKNNARARKGMRAKFRAWGVLALLGGVASACETGCEYYEFCKHGQCAPCTPGTFGGSKHCQAYNATLPWPNASDSALLLNELHERVARCHAHATESATVRSAVRGDALRLCSANGDGEVNTDLIVLRSNGTRLPHAPHPTTVSCHDWEYPDPSAQGCSPCPGNSSRSRTLQNASVFCDACPRGWKWLPLNETCEQCPQCYTTDGLEHDELLSRDEECRPCSTSAADYRVGGCSPEVDQECVLYVPMQDVHKVMRDAVVRQETTAYYRKIQILYYCMNPVSTGIQNFCDSSQDLPPFMDYMYKDPIIQTHALFRPQTYSLVSESLKQVWSLFTNATKPTYAGYAYTIGMMFDDSPGDAWLRSSDFECDAPFHELTGSYVVQLSQWTPPPEAKRYDLVRAAYEGLLRTFVHSKRIETDAENIHNEGAKMGVLFDDGNTPRTFRPSSACSGAYGDLCYVTGQDTISQDCNSASTTHTDKHYLHQFWDDNDLYLYNASWVFTRIENALREWAAGLSADTPDLGCSDNLVQVGVNVTCTAVTGVTVNAVLVHVDGGAGDPLETRLVRHLQFGESYVERFNVTTMWNASVVVSVITDPHDAASVSVHGANGWMHTNSTNITNAHAGVRVCDVDSDTSCCGADGSVAVTTPQQYDAVFDELHSRLCA
tara:strand:- start:85 stop:2169 length:2085 start_codon:yes stop_codon:yes gene_type:complete